VAHNNDTIVAISTPMGRGAIGIVRLSGPDAFKIAEKLFIPSKKKKITDQKGNTILHGRIRLEEDRIEDIGLAAIFKSPHSYTGEDMVELHCHSNPLMLTTILNTAIRFGARLAEPGEFSKRAFLNDKLDLTQADAILNIINARTKQGLSSASKALIGEDKRILSESVQRLEDILVSLEAEIDFPEEEINVYDKTNLKAELEGILTSLNHLITRRSLNSLYANGLKCSIIGKPNVGKSTLINALVGEERAIVSEYPGTTRDVIREFIEIDGVPLSISDTAGISQKSDRIESIGIKRTVKEAEKSDIVIIILDGSEKMTTEDEEIFAVAKEKVGIVAINKSDLPEKIESKKIKEIAGNKNIIRISAKFKTNLEELKKRLGRIIMSLHVGNGGTTVPSSFALQSLLGEATEAAKNAITAIQSGLSIEFIVEDIKDAWKKLGSIVGRKTPEEILNEIFSRFCIGK